MPVLHRPKYSLNYSIEGSSGAPLLLLSNSLGTDSSMWDGQMPGFLKSFRVLRYDNRGHGGSTPAPGPYTLEELASDALLVLLTAVGESSAQFCGLSLGGMVGLWLARHHPQKISKLVACNTAAWLGPREIWDTRIASVKQGGMQAISKTVMERWFTAGFRAQAPQVVDGIEQSFLGTSVEGYVGCCAAIRDMDQRQDLGRIRAKTLVLAGTYDPATPPAAGQFIAGAIEGARYVELPSAHLSNIEAAGLFSDVVLHFLGA